MPRHNRVRESRRDELEALASSSHETWAKASPLSEYGLAIRAELPDDGILITCDIDPTTTAIARGFWSQSPHGDKIDLRLGPALETIQGIDGPLDLVFIDADKPEYPDYWKLIKPLVAVGGVVLADNVCGGGSWWLDDVDHAYRQAIDRFNRLVAGDDGFEAVAVPLRQGVLFARRTSA